MTSKVKHNKTFHLKCGEKFNDLKGLAKNLKNMTQEVFTHHVNEDKNDFSMWMKLSLKEEALAKKINDKIDKIGLELEVLRHIVDNGVVIKTASNKKTVKKINPVVVEKKKAPAKTVEKKVSKKKTLKKE